jgi:hypothetical protein
MLGFLSLNFWDLEWVLMNPSNPFFGSLEASLVFSLVAAVAPLRRAGKELPDGSRDPEKPRWALFAFACLTILLLIGYFILRIIVLMK